MIATTNSFGIEFPIKAMNSININSY